MDGPHVSHYWDGDRHVGKAVARLQPEHSEPAWDMWMLYAPGITWDETVSAPSIHMMITSARLQSMFSRYVYPSRPTS
jgi:hypothetical protein